MGILKGFSLKWPNDEISVGTLEGLACYLNGIDLPSEVYESCDVNYMIEEMAEAMHGIGGMYSYCDGSTFTALYFYGSSFSEMKNRIEPFISEYSLCRTSRIEQIA